jgi:hypothetical protein
MLMTGSCLLACSNDGYTLANDVHHFYATLTFPQHAINLATVASYDTLHIQATALMQDGTPVPGIVTYTSSNAAAVTVDSTGLLTANQATTGTIIRASLTYGGITRTDSTIVAVTNTLPPAPLQQISIVVSAGDSAKVTDGTFSGPGRKTLQVAPITTSGDTLPALVFAPWSADTTIATVARSNNTIVITAHKPGRVMLHVSTLAYGVAKQDSLAFVIGWPTYYLAFIYSRFKSGTRTRVLDFNPGTITVGVGANVLWGNEDTLPVDIVFDNPTAAGALTGTEAIFAGNGTGNIAPFSARDTLGLIKVIGGLVGRSFAHPGRYPYHSTLYGTSGVINVIAEDENTCYSFNADSLGHCINQ